MQKFWKHISQSRVISVLLAVVLVLSMIVPAVAGTGAKKSDITATIKTDKTAYVAGEEVKGSIEIQNNGSSDVEDIQVSWKLPESIQPAEGMEKQTLIDAVKAGKTFATQSRLFGVVKKTAQSTETPKVEHEVVVSDEKGWNEVVEKVQTVKDGEILKVETDKLTVVPKKLISAVTGKDLELVIVLSNGISWNIDGKSIKTENAKDIDFGVELNGNKIPKEKLDEVAKDDNFVELNLKHDGEFGFEAKLEINVDKKNAGKYANLYFFNEKDKKLEFQQSTLIDEAGNTGFLFTHASDYVIVIGEKVVVEEESTTVTQETTTASSGKGDGGAGTGDSAMTGLFAILAVIAVAGLVAANRKKIKAAGMISVIAFTLLGISAVINVAYAETNNESLTVSTTITIDGVETKISADVTYKVAEQETTTPDVEEPTTPSTPDVEEPTTPSTPDVEEPTTPSNPDVEKPTPGNGAEVDVTGKYNRVSVHDPSIIKDTKTGTYYIFGSHMAWAKSTDLINWTPFTNNINRDFRTIFKAEAEWAAKADANYDVSGNLWAPDVIWNEAMGKWCMYMSVNGPRWNSTICLLTADSLDGNWTYVGPVIQSGMTNGFGVTFDYTKVTGETTVNSRYTDRIRNNTPLYEPHAIDPCVTYDDEGNLWMSYGSWSGGIGMIQLDKETGLRDYNVKYTLDETTLTDPYTGYKIAGGNQRSGEASYIEKIGDYYYLFMSYGGLVANGGYSMRIFRSENINGPYVDASGDYARYKLFDNVIGSTGAGDTNGTVGVKLFTYYQWPYMKYGQVAQGHNSAFVDEDGKAYVVYHTRTNDGTEGHSVKVHQLFVNEEGWLVAAPYEYTGETLSKKPYTTDEMTGTYEVLFHKQSINYQGLECVTAQKVTLNADGTVSGDYTGTWTADADSANVTMVLNNVTYRGMFVEQYLEDTTYKTLCFTMLGDNEVEFWGSKYLTGKPAVDMSISAGIVTVPSSTIGDVTFATEGLFGTQITYTSSNPDVLANDGKVSRAEENVDVTVTATYTNGDYSVSKDYTVRVIGKGTPGERVLVGEYYINEKINLSNAQEGTYQVANPFNKNVTQGLEIYNGVSIEFDVEGTGSALSNIIGFVGGGGKLYFTGGSYLGYNATGGYFDANLKEYRLVKDYIKGAAHIKIELTQTGFAVYANGELAYSNETLAGTDVMKGTLTSYPLVLVWLNNTAETLNFGWGNWWEDKFNGTISNVKLYANYVEPVDTTGYAYYQDYTKADISEWSAATISGSIGIKNDGTERGNYLNIAAGGDSGNRGAYAVFNTTEEISGKYTISVDTKLTAGVLTQRSQSVFAILGTDATKYNGNEAVTGGYILKLFNQPPQGTAHSQVNKENQTKWYINDTDTYVDIPVDTWVTITADVDTDAGKALVTIMQDSTELYKGTVTINGCGELMGLQVLRGRGIGTASVDNIKVTTEAAEEPEESLPALEATVNVEGTAYLDKASTITVTFTGNRNITSADVIKIDGTVAKKDAVIGMMTVKDIVYNEKTAVMTLIMAEVNGWHSVDGSYEITITGQSETEAAAKTTVEYALELSKDTAYTAIAPTDNAFTKGYFKVEGSKMYVMTVMALDKIHCDGITAGETKYGWWNGIASELHLNLDGKKYSVGSHIYNDQYANPISWGEGVDASLITAEKAVRSYMAIGTFDNDTDTDKGAVLLNVVDLTTIGVSTLSGKDITFSGFMGPNDGGAAFVVVDAAKTYTIQ